MRKIRNLAWIGLLIAIGLVGCESTRDTIRPPKHPEEYNAPPDDPRYNGPVQYPAEAMDQDPLQKKVKDTNKLPGPMGGGRGGPMGGGRMPGAM